MKSEPSTAQSDSNQAYSIHFQKLDIKVLDADGTIKTPWSAVVVENKTRLLVHSGSGVGEPTADDEERLLAESRSKTTRDRWTISSDNAGAFKSPRVRRAVASPIYRTKKKRRGR
jgi:hypothetical protein